MKLREIRIQYFKSIEDAIVENVGDINIFSGRNNSGKTAIFEALANLRSCRIYPQIQYVDLPPKLFSGKKFKEKIMNITLVFELSNKERSNGIMGYYPQASPEQLDFLIKSNFLQEIEFSFQSFEGATAFGLLQIQVTGTDGESGVIARRCENNQFELTEVNRLLLEDNLTFKALTEKLTSKALTKYCTQKGPLKVNKREPLDFPFKLFQDLMHGVYSFSPFRSSQPSMEAQTTENLTNDGSNLVQRILLLSRTKTKTGGNFENLLGLHFQIWAFYSPE